MRRAVKIHNLSALVKGLSPFFIARKVPEPRIVLEANLPFAALFKCDTIAINPRLYSKSALIDQITSYLIHAEAHKTEKLVSAVLIPSTTHVARRAMMGSDYWHTVRSQLENELCNILPLSL